MAPSKSPQVRLGHIRDEIANLSSVFQTIDYPVFAGTYWMIRTAERGILIIAEAVTALPPELTGRYPEIDWTAIRGMGNISCATNTSAWSPRFSGGS